MDVIASSLKAYEEYQHPKLHGLLTRIRLLWQYWFEQDQAPRKLLRDIIEHDRAEKRRDRRAQHWNKMLFRHGVVISREQGRADGNPGSRSDRLECRPQTTKQAFPNTLPVPAIRDSQRLQDVRNHVTVENVRMLEAMATIGEELKRQTNDKKAEQWRMLMEGRTKMDLESQDMFLEDLAEAAKRRTKTVAELVNLCRKKQLTRLQIAEAVMEKTGRHTAKSDWNEEYQSHE